MAEHSRHPLGRFADFVANYYAITAGFRHSDEWFAKAALRSDFRDRPYLEELARDTSYIKLKKIVRVVDEVEDYAQSHGLARDQVKVLDVGCGNGTYSLCLAYLGYQVVGIDINEKVISQATPRAKDYDNVHFLVAEGISHLEDLNTQYNVILALDSLEHMHDPERFCRVVHEHTLCPGIFVTIIPDGYSEVELLYVPFARFLRNRLLGQRGPEGTEHIQRFTLGRMRRMLVQSGFEYRFVSAVFTTRLPFSAAFLAGFRGLPAYLNIKAADFLPKFMTNSWVVSGTKKVTENVGPGEMIGNNEVGG